MAKNQTDESLYELTQNKQLILSSSTTNVFCLIYWSLFVCMSKRGFGRDKGDDNAPVERVSVGGTQSLVITLPEKGNLQ